ncbi:MAG: hypothetical protein ACRER5_02940 [Pseudomonas sp.]
MNTVRKHKQPLDHRIARASKPDLVIARTKRLADLEQRYSDHAKHFPTPWLDYGPEDPLEADQWINPCVECGRLPAPFATGTLVVVQCQCGAQAPGAHMRWQAIMNWNKSPLAKHPEWNAIPFFFLSDLDVEAARTKLQALREHLELRANLEGMRRVVGFRVGGDYLQRLKAYLAWCHYAQSLLNRASPRK